MFLLSKTENETELDYYYNQFREKRKKILKQIKKEIKKEFRTLEKEIKKLKK